MNVVLASLSICISACGDPDTRVSREVVLEATVDASGYSEELVFEIPQGTRSVSVVVQGATDGLYALGTFALGDDADLVHLPNGSPGEAMAASYDQEQIGQMAAARAEPRRLGDDVSRSDR
jgi:hypothetical protein